MCVLHVACHLICVVHFDLSCQVRCNGAERFDGGATMMRGLRMLYVEGATNGAEGQP